MKVLFSNPPWWLHNPTEGLRYGIRAGSRWPFTAQAHCAPDDFSFGGYLPVPFFQTYAAAYAQRAFPDATIIIRDSIARRESYQSFFEFVEHERPDFILVESATPCWDHDRALLRNLTALLPGVRLLVAGTITSTRAAEALAIPGVVAAIQGEYEKGTVHALRGEVGVIGHDLLTREEMNAAPFPMVDEGSWNHYWDACPKGQTWPHLQFWSSRGCPYRCQFCGWPAVMTGNDPDGTGKRTVRNYTPEYMEAYLREETTRHPYVFLSDDSDTGNLQERHTLELCEVYAKIGLPWAMMCRADTSKESTWREMKRAGCVGVKLGFESGSQRVIDKIINKHLDLKKAAETARFLRSIGLTVHGTFSIGHCGETPAEAQQTIDFIRDLYATGAIDTNQLSGTAVIEGTPMSKIDAGEHLKSYGDSKADENYRRSTDGQKKAEGLFK